MHKQQLWRFIEHMVMYGSYSPVVLFQHFIYRNDFGVDKGEFSKCDHGSIVCGGLCSSISTRICCASSKCLSLIENLCCRNQLNVVPHARKVVHYHSIASTYHW